MRSALATLLVTSLAAVSAFAASCVDDGLEIPADGVDPAADLADGKADGGPRLPIRFLSHELFLPSHLIDNEIRAVFHDADELRETLEIDNPGIDFAHEWAVFYTPGMSRPDLPPGFQARIDSVALSATGLTLKVTTALEKNGNCAPRRSRPFLLVAIPIPDDPPIYTRYYRADRTRSCAAATYLDGVAFSSAQLEASLRAANTATTTQLRDEGITGSPASILLDGRPWSSLGLLSSRPGIGAGTMTKLRTLGADF